MNKKAMLEIADLIQRSDAKSFHMGSWFGRNTEFDDLDDDAQYEMEGLGFGPGDKVNVSTYSSWLNMEDIVDQDFQNSLKCDTTACIAGWAVFNAWLQDKDRKFGQVQTEASEILDLSWLESKRLFFCEEGSIWDEVAHEYEFDYDRDHPETWDLPNIMVASVLRRIANGDLKLHEEYVDDEECEDDDAELV